MLPDHDATKVYSPQDEIFRGAQRWFTVGASVPLTPSKWDAVKAVADRLLSASSADGVLVALHGETVHVTLGWLQPPKEPAAELWRSIKTALDALP